MGVWESAWEYVSREWHVIMRAKLLFGIALVLAMVGTAFVTWRIATFYYDRQIADLSATIGLLQTRIETGADVAQGERHLTDEQRSRLIAALREASLKTLEICSWGNPETTEYAQEIVKAAQQAIVAVDWCSMLSVGRDQIGITVLVKDASHPTKESEAIFKAFQAAGLNIHYHAEADLLPQEFPRVQVGPAHFQ